MAGYDRLTPEGEKLFAEIAKLQGLEVQVGFQQGEASEEGVDLASVALWNELGTENIPERPFLRQSVDDNSSTINSFCQAQLQGLTQGKTAADVYKAIGVMQKGLVQEKIGNGNFVANAESTIKKKKSNKPLIHHGTMRQAVNFVIKQRGG